jgi:hypothetical protein
LVDAEIGAIERRSGGRLEARDAGAVLAFVLGALVLGAFAPRKTSGFAGPSARVLAEALAEARDARGRKGISAGGIMGTPKTDLRQT